MVEDEPLDKVNADDPKRGTGRTAALMLHAIADALESPDLWIVFRDHHAHPISMNRTYLRCIQGMARRLGLTVEVGDRGGRIMLRSPITAMRKAARKGL